MVKRYMFGRVGNRAPDYGVNAELLAAWEAGNIDKLMEFFLPHIKHMARYYALQTDYPAQNFKELYSEGCLTLIQTFAAYKPDMAQPFQAVVKEKLNNALLAICDELNQGNPYIPHDNTRSPSPENLTLKADRDRLLHNAMEKELSLKQRTFLHRRYWDGADMESLREEFGYRTNSAIKDFQTRAIKKLRAKVGRGCRNYHYMDLDG
jgi:RNA polymerase sigma factor (sigma-70 family)